MSDSYDFTSGPDFEAYLRLHPNNQELEDGRPRIPGMDGRPNDEIKKHVQMGHAAGQTSREWFESVPTHIKMRSHENADFLGKNIGKRSPYYR